MPAETQITFRSVGNELTLAIQGRPFHDADSSWDRDALNVSVIADTGEFRGKVHVFMSSTEIASLHQILVELNESVGQEKELTFGSMEPAVEISFMLGNRGQLTLNVEVCDGPMYDTRLLFAIEADQSFLPTWIEQVSESLAKYPVVAS